MKREAQQALLERAFAAEKKAEAAMALSERSSRQLAQLRSRLLKVEEERDKAVDLQRIAMDESHNLRLENVKLRATLQRLGAAPIASPPPGSGGPRPPAQPRPRSGSGRPGSGKEKRDKEMETLAREFEAEARERKASPAAATKAQAMHRGKSGRLVAQGLAASMVPVDEPNPFPTVWYDSSKFLVVVRYESRREDDTPDAQSSSVITDASFLGHEAAAAAAATREEGERLG